ncbi:MAG: hypothetical protein QXR17_07020 [Candidatus Bathyarchaeia archaeon]
MTEAEKFKVSDFIYGLIVPVIVGLLIVAWKAYLPNALLSIDPSYTLNAILIDGFLEALMVIAIPMFLGLLWNKWAGGAAGFLLGSLYAVYWAVQYVGYGVDPTDVSLLGYIVSAILIGYVAGALSKGSFNFIRMIVAGIIAAIVGWAFYVLCGLISTIPGTMESLDPYTIFITLTPRLVYGIIVPVIVKVFYWYGVIPRRIS